VTTTLRPLPVLVLLAAVACSTGGPTIPSPGSLPPVQTNTVIITSSGASPRNIEVAVGSRVLFINNDTRSHNMASDDHPDHLNCLPLNQVGFLSAGQQRETGNLTTVQICGYHDHDMPNNQALVGQIIVRQADAGQVRYR
jgi:plastocyanin